MADRISSQPLKTKLFIPQARSGLVRRPRLTALLAQEPGYRLTLLSAPPGFGKTTLLAEWAAQNETGLGWVSLDGGDNDPARFLACLLEALVRTGKIGPDLASLLRSSSSLPVTTILETLLDALEAAADPFAVVLDDYHVIHAQAVHDLLIFLLEHMPPQMHLVISTRADPPIPLARLRARGQLLELRSSELRFTAEESAAFLKEVMGLALTAEQVSVLEERTEGWIAGLQLAALSMRGRQDIAGFLQAFSGSHRFILDYLVEEVINRQPEAVQQFLLQTSILERLSAPLCAALTGTEGAQAMLEHLERANLFLVALDDERQWYRYHHLFGDLLQARLQQGSPALIPALHLRAADWLEASGFVVEAIQHCLLANEYQRAAGLIEVHGHTRWSLGDMTFMGLLSQLPLEMFQTRPSLGVYRVWAMILYGQFSSAEALAQQMQQHLPGLYSSPESDGVRGFLDVLSAYISMLTGKAETLPLPGRQVLEFIPEQFLAMRNSADVMYAMLLSSRAQFGEAAEILDGAVQRDITRDGTTAIPIAISMLGRMLMVQGKLRQAAHTCQEYAALVSQRDRRRFYISGNLDIVWGEILLEWNDLPAAEQKILEGMRWNEAWNIPNVNLLELCVLARLQLALGNLDGAGESLAKAEAAIAGRTASFEQVNELRILDFLLKTAGGTAVRSREWASSFPAGFADEYRWEQNALILARLLIREENYPDAQRLLAQLEKNATTGKRFGRVVKILLLQALAFFALGKRVEAAQRLECCLDLAAEEGYMRVFVEEGEPVRVLFAQLSRSGSKHPEYIRRLLKAFPQGTPAGSKVGLPAGSTLPVLRMGKDALVEPLTPREGEVLVLLSTGYSNQEIAEKLVITVSAVKKHTGNIYGKLGVTSRTQAIARARELGLLGLE